MLLFAWPLLWITTIKILLDSSLLCSVGHPDPDIVETHSSPYPSHGQSFRSLPNSGETTTVATVKVSNILTKTSLTTLKSPTYGTYVKTISKVNIIDNCNVVLFTLFSLYVGSPKRLYIPDRIVSAPHQSKWLKQNQYKTYIISIATLSSQPLAWSQTEYIDYSPACKTSLKVTDRTQKW